MARKRKPARTSRRVEFAGSTRQGEAPRQPQRRRAHLGRYLFTAVSILVVLSMAIPFCGQPLTG